MVLRTVPEPEIEIKIEAIDYYAVIFDKFKKLIDKYVVNENDALRLLEQVDGLHDDIQKMIRDTLSQLGDIREY